MARQHWARGRYAGGGPRCGAGTAGGGESVPAMKPQAFFRGELAVLFLFLRELAYLRERKLILAVKAHSANSLKS